MGIPTFALLRWLSGRSTTLDGFLMYTYSLRSAEASAKACSSLLNPACSDSLPFVPSSPLSHARFNESVTIEEDHFVPTVAMNFYSRYWGFIHQRQPIRHQYFELSSCSTANMGSISQQQASFAPSKTHQQSNIPNIPFHVSVVSLLLTYPHIACHRPSNAAILLVQASGLSR